MGAGLYRRDGPFVPAGLETLVQRDEGTYCVDENRPEPPFCRRGDADWTIIKAASR